MVDEPVLVDDGYHEFQLRTSNMRQTSQAMVDEGIVMLEWLLEAEDVIFIAGITEVSF